MSQLSSSPTPWWTHVSISVRQGKTNFMGSCNRWHNFLTKSSPRHESPTLSKPVLHRQAKVVSKLWHVALPWQRSPAAQKSVPGNRCRSMSTGSVAGMADWLYVRLSADPTYAKLDWIPLAFHTTDWFCYTGDMPNCTYDSPFRTKSSSSISSVFFQTCFNWTYKKLSERWHTIFLSLMGASISLPLFMRM